LPLLAAPLQTQDACCAAPHFYARVPTKEGSGPQIISRDSSVDSYEVPLLPLSYHNGRRINGRTSARRREAAVREERGRCAAGREAIAGILAGAWIERQKRASAMGRCAFSYDLVDRGTLLRTRLPAPLL